MWRKWWLRIGVWFYFKRRDSTLSGDLHDVAFFYWFRIRLLMYLNFLTCNCFFPLFLCFDLRYWPLFWLHKWLIYISPNLDLGFFFSLFDILAFTLVYQYIYSYWPFNFSTLGSHTHTLGSHTHDLIFSGLSLGKKKFNSSNNSKCLRVLPAAIVQRVHSTVLCTSGPFVVGWKA